MIDPSGTVPFLGLQPSVPAVRTTASPKDVKAAAEGFEEILLGQLLKGMRRTVPEGSDLTPARQLYNELFDETLASHLARNGGIGLAELIRTYLERSGEGGGSR